MNENQNDGKKDIFAEVGHFLGRSRNGRFFVAFTISSLFCGLAYIASHSRDLAATVLTVGLLVYGNLLAWRILPFSGASHARWLRQEKLTEHCPATHLRGLLWVGIGVWMANFWRSDSLTTDDGFTYSVSALLIVVGAISYILCRRFTCDQ